MRFLPPHSSAFASNPFLRSLLSPSSPRPIVEQALGILRNITCVTNNEAITGLGRDEMGEERLLGLLEAWVAGGSTMARGGGEEGGEVVVLVCPRSLSSSQLLAGPADFNLDRWSHRPSTASTTLQRRMRRLSSPSPRGQASCDTSSATLCVISAHNTPLSPQLTL